MRLIDLHCNWSLQYACETSDYDPSLYQDIPSRLTQVEGYLTSVAAAVLCCGRRHDDWARLAAPWQVLGEMITRYEAEFPGRLLRGSEDVARWRNEPEDGLCWGVLAVEGLDFLVRSRDDLDRLPGLVSRGVRIIQLINSPENLLAGCDAPEDDRGLSELGRETIDRLIHLEPPDSDAAPRLALDISRLNARSTRDVLAWYEHDPVRSQALPLIRSHGAIETAGEPTSSGLDRANLERFRSLGGTLGLSVGQPFASSPEQLRAQIETAAALPLRGRPGYEGIGIGSDFLGLVQTNPSLENASATLEWLARTFPQPIAEAIAFRSSRRLIRELAGSLDPD